MKRFKTAKLTAVDYSELSVEKAKEYNKEMIREGRCDVRQGNVADLKLPDASYDLATAFETIYFWPGLEKCFAQVLKVLKPGGFFFICNESDGADAAGVKYETIIDSMKCYTTDEIASALKTAGFAEVKCVHHPAKPWVTILARK